MIDMTRGPARLQERGQAQDSLLDDQSDQPADAAAFLREIAELTTVPMVGPGDITVASFAKVARVCRKTARARLDKLVSLGILTTPEGKRREPGTNRQVRVWRNAQE